MTISHRRRRVSEDPFSTTTTTTARAAVLAWAAWCVFRIDRLNESTDLAWRTLSATWWFRHDSFEPWVASTSFMLWLYLFLFIDYGWIFPNYFSKRMIHKKKDMKAHWSGIPVRALIAYWAPLLFIDFWFPRRAAMIDRFVTLPSPTFFQIVFGVIQTVLVYDLLFFPIHLLLHKLRSLNRLHSKHHRSVRLVATDVLNHSFVDGSLQVIANVVALKVTHAHPMVRMIHNVLVTYLLTESHSGIDCEWMVHRLIPFRLFGGPRAHELHHSVHTKNFAQFSTYLDRMVGTYMDPYER